MRDTSTPIFPASYDQFSACLEAMRRLGQEDVYILRLVDMGYLLPDWYVRKLEKEVMDARRDKSAQVRDKAEAQRGWG